MKGFALCDLAVRRDQSPIESAAVLLLGREPQAPAAPAAWASLI